MSAAQSSIERNTNGTVNKEFPAPPLNVAASTISTKASAQRLLTLAQEEIVRAFTNEYDIGCNQIGFKGESLDPIFDFDALSTLALALTDFQEITVEPGDFNAAAGIATAIGNVILSDGRLRGAYGHCVIGQVLHDGSEVSDLSTAMGVARARALRTVLRMAGFDPVRAHRAHQGEDLPFSPADEIDPHTFDPRTKDIREIHALAAELKWITNGDDAEYVRQIGIYFPGFGSSKDMSDAQRSQFIAIMRALKNARTQAALPQR